MTKLEQEKKVGTDVIIPICNPSTTEIATLPILQSKSLEFPAEISKKKLNYGPGTASWCLDTIVVNNDMMEAKGRIKANREEGKSLKK